MTQAFPPRTEPEPDPESHGIRTYEELVQFAESVNNGGAANAHLENNIVAPEDSVWTEGIGTADVPYNGVFDGRGCYIVGLNVNSTVYGGLFGVIGSEGVVGVITDNWDPGVEDTGGEKRQGTQIPGYSTAEMKAGDTTLRLSIGNPKDNKVGFYASLRLGDDTVLYESPLLEPGQGLTEVPLNKTLEKGDYDAKVVYRCVALDEEHTPLNAAESGFRLIVN